VIPLLLALALAAPSHGDLKRARDRFEFGAWADAAGSTRGWLADHPDATGPDAVEAWRILGISEFHLGDLNQSRAAFVSLLSLDPRSWVRAIPVSGLVGNQRPYLAITATVMTSAVISVNCAAADQRLRYQFCMKVPTITHPNHTTH